MISTKEHQHSALTQLTLSFLVTGPMVQKTTLPTMIHSTVIIMVVILDSRKSSRATMTRSTLEMEIVQELDNIYLLVMETILLILETIGRVR